MKTKTAELTGAALRGLSMQDAVVLLTYEYPEGEAYIQRFPHMSDGPRWKWVDGELVLFRDMEDGPHPLLPCRSQDAYTSKDWVLYAD